MKEKSIIGSTEFVNFGERAQKVPAKIDTGADSSVARASNIRIDKDGVLKFSLFGEGSPHYNGKVFKRTDYSVVRVRSSMGQEQIRYRTHFWVKISGRKIKMLMNLSDRSKNEFPVLIGRRSISGKFLVDVSKKKVRRKKAPTVFSLNEEIKLDPYKFYKKYHQKGGEK